MAALAEEVRFKAALDALIIVGSGQTRCLRAESGMDHGAASPAAGFIRSKLQSNAHSGAPLACRALSWATEISVV